MATLGSHTVSYNAALSACSRAGRWMLVFSLLSHMKESKAKLDAISYSVAVRTCGVGGRWQQASLLIAEMVKASVHANRIVLTAGISACRKGGWKWALNLLRRMTNARWRWTRPDEMAYTAAIGACGQDEQWQQALTLLTELKDAQLELNTLGCNAGIRACEKAGQWQHALALLKESRDAAMEPNIVTATLASSVLGVAAGR